VISSVISPLGVLVLEREPLKYADLPNLLKEWAQDAGGFAALALLIYVLYTLFARRTPGSSVESRLPWWFSASLLFGALAVLCYLPAHGITIYGALQEKPDSGADKALRSDQQPQPPKIATPLDDWNDRLLTAGGICALIGFCLPFFVEMSRLRFRRIWAIAKLSFLEAVRRKVLWVFLAFLLIFLFPPKWFFPIKAEDEVRTNVSVIYWAMTPLLLVVAGLLAAFSIPTDIRNQTIHTIVTKPVERFEIVLGRFLGYVILSSVVLGILTLASLALIQFAGNVSEEAKAESLKARVPVYGNLEFRGRDVNFRGESVGREWDYRRYIAGGGNSSHRAIWVYSDDMLPKTLKDRSEVPCEFSFDIFRTTKGEENKGVFCTFTFVSWQWGNPLAPNADKLRGYQDAVRGLNLNAQPGDEDWGRLDKLAEETGFYEFRSKEVVDYHTFDIKVPGGLFRAAMSGTPPPDAPRLLIVVKCESRTQYLGVAKHDLYLLAADGGFAWNFAKGAFGLWLRLCLVIAIAVACSTYLSGVISWLTTLFLFAAGFFQDFIKELANGTSVGGGPAESLIRLSQNQNLTMPLPESAATTFAGVTDKTFQWVFRRLLDVIPDVDRLNWSSYVAQGFNIDGADLILSTLLVIGYLLPWAVLAHYLMKSREIAS
jgi:ABC-type transport system involved in multi-copper enzyme maturation permease subunit